MLKYSEYNWKINDIMGNQSLFSDQLALLVPLYLNLMVSVIMQVWEEYKTVPRV